MVRRDQEVLKDGKPAELRRKLEGAHQAQPGDPVARPVRNVGFADDLTSAVTSHRAREDVHEGGLARAVRPNERGDLTLRDLEAGAVHGVHTLERFRDTLAAHGALAGGARGAGRRRGAASLACLPMSGRL